MKRLVYYISGHGFGHARRSAEIIRALLQRNRHLIVDVRTSAPRFIFESISDSRLRCYEFAIDRGIVERDPLNPDVPATLAGFQALLDRSEALIDGEVDFVRSKGASLLLADVPFLAGEVAARAGVPCIAVSNFTWDWILEPLAKSEADRELLEGIRRSYAKMSGLVRLPFGHENPQFQRIVDVPLVANRSRLSREQALARLELSSDGRSRILIGMRGGVSMKALRRAASANPRLLLVVPYDVESLRPGNILPVRFQESGVSFADLVAVSDVVLSKLGYGIVADCIAARTRLLWPRRNDFREDDLTASGSRAYIAHRELPAADFHAGDWSEHLEALLAQPMPEDAPRLDGPEVAAKVIDEWG